MNTAAYRKNIRKLMFMLLLVALAGAAYMLVGGQLIVEQVFTYAIPVSVFITVGGGIYFLYLLLTNRRG